MTNKVLLLLLGSLVNNVQGAKLSADIQALTEQEISLDIDGKAMIKDYDGPADVQLIGRDKSGKFKNHDQYLKLRNRINEQESEHSSMFKSINDKLQDKNFLEQAIQMTTTAEESKGETGIVTPSSKSPAGMSDADAKCYTSRYGDVGAKDARDHYLSIGEAEGRLPTCARNLTDDESQRLIYRTPDLQYKYGKTGKYALSMAREDYTDYGFIRGDDVDAESWEQVWYCGDTNMHECDCNGMLYRSYLYDPITNQRLNTFEEIRHWKVQVVEGQDGDFFDCDATTFGGDKLNGARHQCWCEPRPINVPTICADDGDECMCNGYVFYGAKTDGSSSKRLNYYEMVGGNYAINDANNTKKIVCEPKSFEWVDPIEGQEKQCICDENRDSSGFGEDMVQMVKEYWRGVMAEKWANEAAVRAQAEAEAAAKAALEEAVKAAEREAAEKALRDAAAKRAKEEQAAAATAAALAQKEAEEAEKARLAKNKKRREEKKAAAAAALAAQIAAEQAAEAAEIAANAEKDEKKRKELLAAAKIKRAAAMKAQVESALAIQKAEHEAAIEELRAEQEAADLARSAAAAKATKDAQDEAAKDAEAAQKAKADEAAAYEQARAQEKAANAISNQAASEQAVVKAIEQKEDAYERKLRSDTNQHEREMQRRRDAEAKKNARAQATAARMEREREAKKAAEQRKREDAKRKAANLKYARDHAHDEELRLDELRHDRALASQKARQDLQVAQRAQAMAQSQEDIRAAEEATQRAEQDLADKQAKKKEVEEERKQLQDDLAKKQQEADMAEAEAKKALEEQKQAEEAAKEAEAAKIAAQKKSVADIAAMEKKQAEDNARIAKERAANIAKHEAAVKAQKAAFEAAKKAAHEAALAVEAARKKQEAQAIAAHKQEMAEKRAIFEAKFRNVWSTGPTGVSRFRLSSDTKGAAEELIGHLFTQTLVADVEISKNFVARVLQLDQKTTYRNGGVDLVTGVTSDDRIAELIEEVAAHDPNGQKAPAFDLVVMPLAGGSTEYLQWVKQQTLKKDPSQAFFNEKAGAAMSALEGSTSQMNILGTHHFN